MKRFIIEAANIVSSIFNPFYLPVLGMVLLLGFSYLSMLSWPYKLQVLITVFFFTVMAPTFFIDFYRRKKGWTQQKMGLKEHRVMPYIISIVCYVVCYLVMTLMRLPIFMCNIVLAALVLQMICGVINLWWKVSTHSAAAGGVTGALAAYSFIFGFNPIWWLCLVILVSGLVGTSRMILRQHTLWQILAGYFIGLFSAFFVIMYAGVGLW